MPTEVKREEGLVVAGGIPSSLGSRVAHGNNNHAYDQYGQLGSSFK